MCRQLKVQVTAVSEVEGRLHGFSLEQPASAFSLDTDKISFVNRLNVEYYFQRARYAPPPSALVHSDVRVFVMTPSAANHLQPTLVRAKACCLFASGSVGRWERASLRERDMGGWVG